MIEKLGLLALSTALALALVVADAVGAGGPVPVAAANAAVQSCTATFTGQGHLLEKKTATNSGWWVPSLEVPDERHVTDVDFTIDVHTTDAASATAILLRGANIVYDPSVTGIGEDMATGTLDGVYTFDSDARTATVGGASPSPGRYLPASPASALEGTAAAGTWRLWLQNSSTVSALNLRSWSVTLTFATCDSDGDGVQDHLDNCAFEINADQANLDGDSLGDACDPDRDNDGVANEADACPTVAGATTNGCPAPSPPPGPAPTLPVTPAPVATVSQVERSATLRAKKRSRRLLVRVASAEASCRDEAAATLMRVRKGMDRIVTRFTTNAKGKVRLRMPKRKGRYYVLVPTSAAGPTLECGATTSRKVRIR